MHTVLGISNVSFGLRPAARHALNAMFLHECLDAGLDSAIMHAGRIRPLNKIDPEHRQLCLDLIHDRTTADYDPLMQLIEAFEGVTVAAADTHDTSDWPVDARLSQRIIDGNATGLEADLDEALEAGTEPLEVINGPLLAGISHTLPSFGRNVDAGDFREDRRPQQ